MSGGRRWRKLLAGEATFQDSDNVYVDTHPPLAARTGRGWSGPRCAEGVVAISREFGRRVASQERCDGMESRAGERIEKVFEAVAVSGKPCRTTTIGLSPASRYACPRALTRTNPGLSLLAARSAAPQPIPSTA